MRARAYKKLMRDIFSLKTLKAIFAFLSCVVGGLAAAFGLAAFNVLVLGMKDDGAIGTFILVELFLLVYLFAVIVKFDSWVLERYEPTRSTSLPPQPPRYSP